MEDSIICKFKHYRVEGEVAILDWYDCLGTIRMNDFKVQNEDEIKDLLNDGGFGAKEIVAANLSIYKIYEHGAKIFWKHLTLNVREPEKEVPNEILQAFYMEYEE